MASSNPLHQHSIYRVSAISCCQISAPNSVPRQFGERDSVNGALDEQGVAVARQVVGDHDRYACYLRHLSRTQCNVVEPVIVHRNASAMHHYTDSRVRASATKYLAPSVSSRSLKSYDGLCNGVPPASPARPLPISI